jgi:hypothetical protein
MYGGTFNYEVENFIVGVPINRLLMTNSDNGNELIQEIIRSIAKEYSWLDYPINTNGTTSIDSERNIHDGRNVLIQRRSVVHSHI